MRLLQFLKPRSITAQITVIVAIAVALGVILVTTTVVSFFDRNPRYATGSIVAQIGTVTRLMQAAKTEDEIAASLLLAQDTDIKVKRVALADLEVAHRQGWLSTKSSLVGRRLESNWGIDVLDVVPPPGSGAELLVVKLNDREALLFEAAFSLSFWALVLAPTALALFIVLLFVVLLSIYAVRWITAPLSAVAAAAQSFGRSPDDNRILHQGGPREIVQVADALNDMRIRIRALLDDRTRMLAAISHDLRTPLTRLRLRAERTSDQGLRDGLLHDITRMTHMLDETLNYLRGDARSESTSRVDLPSLLQTVCAEFADVGHAVSYEGPPHFTLTCRPNVLARAISNVVDNATKHGTIVTVSLRVLGDRAAEIDVGDDGPGIPPSLREKVFDPFFKGDSARGTAVRSGFGLGLSIARDVVRGHGGEIELVDRVPRGLIVRMRLPGEDASGRGNIS